MATATQVYDALRLHNVFNINNASAPINFSLFDDLTDWGGLSISTANGDTVKLISQVVAPTGIACYENTGFAGNDFSTPDTTLLDLISPTYNLPVYTGGNVYVNGLYTINVKVEVVINGGATFVVDKSFTFDLPKNVTPNLSLSETWNCSIATYTSTDVTSYCTSGCASGYSVTNVVKTHTVYPPAVSGQTSVTSSATTVTLGAPDNQLWTGTYEAKMSAVITLVQGDSTVITHASVTAEAKVVCDDLLCGLYCQLKKLYELYKANLGKNSTEAKRYKDLLFNGEITLFMATKARLCSNEAMVGQFVSDFYKLTGTDPNCDCCKDESSPVIPTNVINGTDGTDGETPEFRVVSETIFQYKFPSQLGWTTIFDFADLSGRDGNSFLQGSGVPSSGTGNNGDSYLNIDTYDIYEKSAGSWSVTGNIKGAQGLTLLVNDLSTTATTGTTTEVLKTYTAPANTFSANGDMLVLEFQFNGANTGSNASAGWLNIAGNAVPMYLLFPSSNVGYKYIVRLTRTSSNVLTIEKESTPLLSLGFEGQARVQRLTQGSLTFSNTMVLSLSAEDDNAGDTSVSLFRITKYKI